MVARALEIFKHFLCVYYTQRYLSFDLCFKILSQDAAKSGACIGNITILKKKTLKNHQNLRETIEFFFLKAISQNAEFPIEKPHLEMLWVIFIFAQLSLHLDSTERTADVSRSQWSKIQLQFLYRDCLLELKSIRLFRHSSLYRLMLF